MKSLILFADHVPQNKTAITNHDLIDISKQFLVATGMHFKSFTDVNDAAKLSAQLSLAKVGYEELIKNQAVDAKNPFQFISNINLLRRNLLFQVNRYDFIRNRYSIPVSMDASSSAYQLMSYMLLNEDLAVKTNLIKLDESRDKFDLYSYLLEELCLTVYREYDKGYSRGVCLFPQS